jgi:Hemerythrin HHE cation binding domain
MAGSKTGLGARHEPLDAIAMLIADHKKVRKLFSEFKRLHVEGSDEAKSAVVQQVCNELIIHAEIEAEIFYPAVRKAIKDSDLMDEVLVEHAEATNLIAQLQDMHGEYELYDAKVTVLAEQIEHHVRDEEGKMFPLVKKAKLDTAHLGFQMREHKVALMKEMGIADSANEDAGTRRTVSKSSPKRAAAAKSR